MDDMVATTSNLRELGDRDPYPRYSEIRQQARVFWDEGMQGWLLTHYEDCAFVERREDLFAMGVASFPGADDIRGRRGILSLRGEPQKQLHKQLARYFSPERVERYRVDFIRPLVACQIDTFAGRGTVEIGDELADYVPIGAVAAALGLPWQDRQFLERCKGWMERIMAWSQRFGSPPPQVLASALDAAQDLDAALLPLIRRSREEPGDDLIGELWRVGPSVFDDWGEQDVLAQAKVMFEGGSDTSSRLICSLAHLLATRPDLRAQVAADRASLVPKLVEEALRLYNPLQLRLRVATRDVELAGVLIRQGQRVHPINAAANRDPARFLDPDQIDLERPSFMNHLTFNVGPRHCVGAAFARAELVEVADAILTRLQDLHPDPRAEPPRFLGFINRGFRPVHLLFDPEPTPTLA